jgi:hypothetical protein
MPTDLSLHGCRGQIGPFHGVTGFFVVWQLHSGRQSVAQTNKQLTLCTHRPAQGYRVITIDSACLLLHAIDEQHTPAVDSSA